jgi:hypothetical protein
MLACSDGRQRYFLVQRIGGGDADHIDLCAVDQRTPVGDGMGKSHLPRRPVGGILRHIGQHVQVEPHGQVKYVMGCGIAEGMRLAHKARTDQADP